MLSGRRGHPTGRARLRSGSGRSRPRHQALRSPTPAPQPAAAAPRLPRTAVPAGEHHPRPDLDDVAERPQIPGGSRRVQRLVQFLGEPATVGRQAAPPAPAAAARAGPGRSPLGHASPRASSLSRPVFAHECAEPSPPVPGWSADSWPYTPPPGATAWHGGEHPRHPPHRRAMPHPRCIAVLRRLRVKRRAKRWPSSVMTRPLIAGLQSGVDAGRRGVLDMYA
jgi:hypothetical protein